MRKIRYQVACSLDGYIAGPEGEYDWIVTDPDIDFNALFDQRVYEKSGIVLLKYDVVRAGRSGEGS